MARRKSPRTRSRSRASSSPLAPLLKLLPKRFAVIAGAVMALLALLPEKWRPFPLPLPDAWEEKAEAKPRKAKPVLKEFAANIISIADGDTATVTNTDTGEKVKIRFAGIDAPESKQKAGAEAKRELERLLKRKGKLSVLPHEIDRYERTVGDLYLDGKWINLEMVQAGWAWHYAAYSKDSRLAAAMVTAKKERRGLWRERSPVAPWEWRKQAK